MQVTYTQIISVAQPSLEACRRQGEANRVRFMVTHPSDYLESRLQRSSRKSHGIKGAISANRTGKRYKAAKRVSCGTAT